MDFPVFRVGPRKVWSTPLYMFVKHADCQSCFKLAADEVGFCVRGFVGMLFKTLVEEESYLGYRSEIPIRECSRPYSLGYET